MKIKQLIIVIAVNIVITAGGLILLGSYILKRVSAFQQNTSIVRSEPMKYVNAKETFNNDLVDLSEAAKIAMPAVVQVKAKFPARKKDSTESSGVDIFLEEMIGSNMGPNMTPEQRASGSGVIISEDGYIITNAHVITNDKGAVASEVIVTSRTRRMYKAKIIGYDIITDMAVLKID